MDFCRNVSVSGGLPSNYHPEQQLLSPSSCSKLGSLDDLFSGHTTEEGDVNLEWLSMFVEDCLSSSGNCLPPAALASNPQSTTTTAITTPNTVPKTSKPLQCVKTKVENTLPLHKFVVPGKARSKRKRKPIVGPTTPFKRTSCWSNQALNSDPPLLQQAYWLADSELILPKKEGPTRRDFYVQEEEEGGNGVQQQQQQQQGRRCSHCLSQRTPQWRAGPLGPKTLCNACGVRYKSGRLLPEYRPAKSPTFVSCKHSNSHKKVLEMRMSLTSD